MAGRRSGRESAPKARDFTNRRYRHRGIVDEVERATNRTKSEVRARVEHAIITSRPNGSAHRSLKDLAPPASISPPGSPATRRQKMLSSRPV
jgi:hypothetical protein